MFEGIRLNTQQCSAFIDQPFAHHVHRAAHQGGGVHFAVARLQAIEAAFFDRELEVLHLAVMCFQAIAQGEQLLVHDRHLVFQGIDRFRCTDAGDDILALRVDQVFAEQAGGTGIGVAGEADAGGAVVTEVAEYHGNDVDGGAVGHVGRDMKFAPVVHRPLAEPGVEHRLDRQLELLHGVFRKGPARFPFHQLEKTFGDFQQIAGIEGDVVLDAGFFLDRFELGVEDIIADAERHLAEQLDETPVGIPAEAFVTGLLDKPLECVRVQAEV